MRTDENGRPQWTPLLIAVGVVAFACAVQACAALGGAVLPALDTLNHAAPFWLVCALLGAAVTLLAFPPGRLRILAVSGFAASALVQAALVVPEFLSEARPQVGVGTPAEARSVRIVWLNTHLDHEGAEAFAPYLVQTGADIIVLADFHVRNGVAPTALTDVYPHFVRCAVPHNCDVAILSKRSPVRALHARTPRPARLRLTWAEFDVDGAPLRVIAAHPHRRLLADWQVAQFQALEDTLANGPIENVVLAGDFNVTPWSFALKRLDRTSGLTRHSRALPTWPAQAWTRLRLPAPAPFLPIDHIYSGRSWRLAALRRGPRTNSDHYPLEATFVWTGRT